MVEIENIPSGIKNKVTATPAKESEKIKAEIDYLQALTKELNHKAIPSKEKWNEKIKKWTSVVIAIISVGAGIWGLIIPINRYITEKKTILKYELNSQMVDLITKLDANDPAISDRSILLLSYYERNSLPILFYKLNRISAFTNENLISNISQTIANIYESNNSNKKEITTTITVNLENQIQTLKSNNQIDDFNKYAIYNLLFVIEQLPLNKRDLRKFSEVINQIEEDLLIIDKEKIKHSMLFIKIAETRTNLKIRKS